MHFLVTGANGFIGSALCNELAARGHKHRRVLRHVPAGEAAYACGELDGNTVWLPALETVDVVVHLAARVPVVGGHPSISLAEFRRTNVEATLNLARQAVQAGVQRLVFVSSIKVNGEYSPAGQTFSETSIPAPCDPYALSKWEAEQALLQLGRETGLEVVIVRPPLVYGPGVRANFLHLLARVNGGWPLPFKSITNQRSLLFVGNLVDALILCATHPQAAGQTYLIDDGQARSSGELVAAMASSLGVQNRDFPLPVGLLRVVATALGRRTAVERLTQSLVVSSDKLRGQVGWQPPYSFEAGMRLTSEWYKRRAAGEQGMKPKHNGHNRKAGE